jgi:hypothetical protein
MSQPNANPNDDAAADQTADRIRELNERMIEAARRAGQAYLDVYERTLATMADFQERVGERSQVDWIQNLTNAQATFLRETGRAYSETMRSVLK